MPFFISLLPATVLAVLGYLTLYCSLRSGGGAGVFGRALAAWVFFLALLLPLSGAYLSITGSAPMGEHFRMMHGQDPSGPRP